MDAVVGYVNALRLLMTARAGLTTRRAQLAGLWPAKKNASVQDVVRSVLRRSGDRLTARGGSGDPHERS